MMGRLDGIRRWWHRMVDCFHQNHDMQYSGPWVPGWKDHILRIGEAPERYKSMHGVCKNCGCHGDMIHYPRSGRTRYVTYETGRDASQHWKGASYERQSTGGIHER